MKSTDVSAVVSPGNSYGQMTGGYDLAITKYFGEELMKAVQRVIVKEHFGEQLVGTSIVVDIPNTNKKLIHVPTMKVPSLILDPMVIYSCMRATLMAALKNKIRTVVIPAFGGGCGKVSHNLIALKMKEAYDQIKNHL
jgi:O-acetyl-ADP-ribose deacetylase (regulator of RNase III)